MMLSKETIFCSIIRASILQNYFSIIALGGKMSGQGRNMVVMVVEQSCFWISILIICTYSYNYGKVTVPRKNCTQKVTIIWCLGLLALKKFSEID